jgi:carboxylesterase
MKDARKQLQSGVQLPSGTYMKIFHSKHDPTASSTSTVLIYNGMTTSNGSKVDVKIMDSEIHVFTRLALRDNVSSTEINNQKIAFEEIAQKLN